MREGWGTHFNGQSKGATRLVGFTFPILILLLQHHANERPCGEVWMSGFIRSLNPISITPPKAPLALASLSPFLAQKQLRTPKCASNTPLGILISVCCGTYLYSFISLPVHSSTLRLTS